ncbi:hypothetical protein E2C01_092807 [Portunus trituberculatus]|uniref:Uncharacterized protein n=1 Tax=Portunus trituberculatus TaxID=210409 RepID=A0A5B7JRL7_PORTR|nr:hypothetical protein [Portunus trituberculatus]
MMRVKNHQMPPTMRVEHAFTSGRSCGRSRGCVDVMRTWRESGKMILICAHQQHNINPFSTMTRFHIYSAYCLYHAVSLSCSHSSPPDLIVIITFSIRSHSSPFVR